MANRLPTYTAEAAQYQIPSGSSASASDFTNTTGEAVSIRNSLRAAGAMRDAYTFAANAQNAIAQLTSLAPTAGAFKELGKVGQDAANTLVQLRVQNDISSAYVEASQMQASLVQKMDQYYQDGQPVTERLQEDLNAAATELRNSRTTPKGIAAAEERIATMQANLGHIASQYDAKIAGQNAKDQLYTMQQSDAAALRANPELFLSVINDEKNTIKSYHLPKQVETALLQQSQDNLARTVGVAWVNADAYDAENKLTAGLLNKYADPKTVDALIKLAQSAQRTEEAQKRAQQVQLNEQAKKEQEFAYNTLTSRLYSGGEPVAAVLAEAQQLSLQIGVNGEPKLPPTMMDSLRAKAKAITDAPVHTDYPTYAEGIQLLDTGRLTQEWLDGAMGVNGGKPKLSTDQLRFFATMYTEGSKEVRAARSQVINAMIPSGLTSFSPEAATQVAQLHTFLVDQEKQWVKDGHSRYSYYSDPAGFLRDRPVMAKMISDVIKQTPSHMIKPGDVTWRPDPNTGKPERVRYTGKNPTDLSDPVNFEPAPLRQPGQTNAPATTASEAGAYVHDLISSGLDAVGSGLEWIYKDMPVPSHLGLAPMGSTLEQQTKTLENVTSGVSSAASATGEFVKGAVTGKSK